MNCLEYRRQRSAGEAPSPSARAHADACSACLEFERRTQQFERALQGAVAMPVPDGLADRVLFRRRNGVGWSAIKFAAAASVMLFVTIATEPLWLRGLAPADAVLAHIALEEPFERLLAHGTQSDFPKVALAESGFDDLRGQQIQYLGICPVPGGKGHHFIVTTAQGEASLVLIPDRSVEGRQQSERFGRHALVLPAKRGSYALVAGSVRELEAIEAAIRPNVRTSI